MRILLVNPSYFSETEKNDISKHANYPPLGLCYIAAVLEKNNYDVSILDARSLQLTKAQFRNEVVRGAPDIVGFVAYLTNHKFVLESARVVKEINAKIKVLVGGPNATALKESLLKASENIDLVICGEGEDTMLELVSCLENKTPLGRVRGLIYREGRSVKVNKQRPMIANLDKLPFPARHLLPDITDTKLYGGSFRHKRLPMTSIITSRGCPYGCIFCDRVFGKRFRPHSADYVVKEIKHLIQRYGVKEIHIFDDTFIVDTNRVKEICNRIVHEKIDLTWSCNGRVDILYRNKDLIPLMKKAGCWYMSFGVESGNQKVLNYLKKAITLEQTREVIKLAHRHNIMTGGYFILGSPIDTEETIQDTIEFAKSLPLDTAQFGTLIPYKGTEVYDIARKMGKLRDIEYEEMTARSGKPVYVPEAVTEDKLVAMQKQAYKEFMLRPAYVLRQLKNMSNPYMLRNYIKTGQKYILALTR